MFSIRLKTNTAMMLIDYLQISFEELRTRPLMELYEFHCWSFFDVKLSYVKDENYFYLKSYLPDPKGNISHLLNHIRKFRKKYKNKDYTSHERDKEAMEYYKNNTKHYKWINVRNQ
jgi:hypothetical protein